MKNDSKHLDDGGGLAAEIERIAQLHAGQRAREECIAREMGSLIGFGRMMQLGQKLWREQLIAQGLNGGGEFSIGPCVAFMVRCQCVEEERPEFDSNGHCEWCCGSHQVTERVRQAQKASRPSALPPDDESRCACCAGPLAESVSEGCVRGNCSQRPLPTKFYAPDRVLREQIELKKGRAR